MARMLFIAVLLVPLGLLADDRPTAPVKQSPTPQSKLVVVFPLTHVPAKPAAEAITKLVEAKRGLARLSGRDVESADFAVNALEEENSLVVRATKADLDEIKAVVRELDWAREKIVITSTVSLTGADGQSRVLSRPQIITLDGWESSISIGLDDGSEIKFKLVPRIVREDD